MMIMSLAKRMRHALDHGSTEEKYVAVARFLLMKYALTNKEEFRKQMFKYADMFNLSTKKLGTIVYQMGV